MPLGMTRLSVNLNKIALLRNARHTGVPDVLQFAKLSRAAGIDGLTIHPRPDERHIRTHDAYDLAKLMEPWRAQGFELNIEGRPDARLLQIIADTKPEQVTLVPDAPSAFTSDKGWDVTASERQELLPFFDSLRRINTRIILFIDPNSEIPSRVKDIGADGIEIYTGTYADAFRRDDYASALQNIADTFAAGRAAGLHINAGHDLNLLNLPPLAAHCDFFECSIGHELTADALIMGWDACLKAYRRALNPVR